MERQIVATFFKTAGGRLRMDSLTMIHDKVGYLGRTYVARDQYDVDFSRRYGYIYHNSGGGGDEIISVDGIYFSSGNPQVKEGDVQFVDSSDSPPWTGVKTLAIRKRNKTRRLKTLPIEFTKGFSKSTDLFDWLENNAIEDDAVYCSTCEDYVPGQQGCDHVWWCNATGDYSTPDERCSCKSPRVCWGGEDEE